MASAPYHTGWVDSRTVSHGYWGAPTANTDWCEPNYLWSHYIAEFWNTLSCIPICTFALHGLSQCYRHSLELKFWASYLGVLVIGIGSVAFHGTLHRWGQVMDEVPMLWASLCFLYVSMTMDGARPLLAAGLTCWGAFSTIVYFSWGFHLFVVMYAATVVVVVLYSARASRRSGVWPQLRKWAAAAAGLYVGGFLFLWLPEVLLCPSGSHVPVVPGGYPWLRHVNGHAWFHLTSAAGPYVFMTFSTFNRYHCLRRAPTFHWRQPHPALLLPFRIPVVHVLSVPE